MELPITFLEEMKELLGAEFEDFLASYDKDRVYGFRLNTLKGEGKALLTKLPFTTEPVAWCDTGFYYQSEEKLGKHPFHEAGLYYIQEPSAMISAELAQAEPGDVVLDLCAAPGGKTTQLACKLQGKGLLISNEINPQRATILSQNVERMGVKNAIVTNESPQKLSKVLTNFFDKIIVDAPCSGEGMFRKEPLAVSQWSLENVKMCAERQAEILECAAMMLKPGGRMVYSTCTFSKLENEDTIAHFLERHGEFHMISSHRIWPHKEKGEGHFAAVLQKEGQSSPAIKKEEKKKLDKNLTKIYEEFMKENFSISLDGNFIMFGEQLYCIPKEAPELKGLKVLRPGLHIGSFKKNRFEPAHALSHALQPKECRHVLSLSAEQPETLAYLKGETIQSEDMESGVKGWYLVCVEGVPMGFAKYSNGMFKNHYPKGLRIQV